MRKRVFVRMLAFAAAVLLTGCGAASNTGGVPDPDKIVPSRDGLIQNLTDSGYTVETLSEVVGLDMTVDRVFAKKGDRFVDIVYGASDADASQIFEAYCGLYPDGYYILAQNGSYVYCVSDKKTFAKAGFTSTGNVGVQYIHN